MDLDHINELTRKLTGQPQIAKPVFINPMETQMKQLEEINRENYRRREEERLANKEGRLPCRLYQCFLEL